MTGKEKAGFNYPEFSPNENPFVTEQKNGKHKIKSNKETMSNDIFDDDDSGDYASLNWS